MSNGRVCLVSVVRPARDVRTFEKEARTLVAAGWDVTVVGRDDGRPTVVDGVRVLPVPPARGVGRLGAQLRALRLVLGTRAQTVQVADVELLPAALVLKAAGRTVLYDCIEDYPAYMAIKSWLPRALRPVAARVVETLERVVAPRLDAVLTADAGTAERLRGYGARVAVVHNFPRRDQFAAAPPGTPRAHDVLYHGSLPPYHLDALAGIAVALARRVPGARWAIVGEPDDGAARARFDGTVAAAGLDGQVVLRPRVAFAAVPALLRGAGSAAVPLPDVPKFRTNLPMKVFEYLAAGVPTVTSDLPPVRRVTGDAGAVLLVPPGDVEAFADALAGILRDPAHARRLAARGRALIEERCHWEREAAVLLECYARLGERRLDVARTEEAPA